MDNSLTTYRKLLGKQQIIILISTSFILLMSLLSNYNLYSIFGLGLTIFVTLRLIIVMDETIPVIEIMLLIAGSQWIVGPFIDYQTKIDHHKMHMYVSEDVYMKITIPLYFIFLLASLQFSKFIPINRLTIINYLDKNKTLPYYIIGLGFITTLIKPILPPSLAFVGYLAINSSLVGLGLFYFVKTKWLNKYIITGIVFLPLAYKTINSGMFHTLIIWGLFTFVFINLAKRITLTNKILILSFSVFALFSLQLIKKDYRQIIYNSSYQGNKLELFSNLLVGGGADKLNGPKKNSREKEQNNVNSRLNQGWIISKIYARIPQKADFVNGETVISAIESSLIPRFLSPSKKGGGGKATFESLTGLKLSRGTAMGTSILGEFYGNFGVYGGMFAFLIWGTLLKFVIQIFQQIQKTSPIIIFWLPIVFFQVIKAESDLTTVLNHLIKSLIFISFLMFGLKKFLHLKHEKSASNL